MIQSSQISPHETRQRMFAAIATLVVGVLVLLLKFWAFNITKSQAIYSDALESIVNVITAAIGISVVYYAAKPADEDHPYGHGKVEYFSSAFEGGLITFAAIAVFYGVVQAQLSGTLLFSLERGMGIIAIAGVINMITGMMLKRVGGKYASPALQAAGTHLLIDFWTTVGALAGVGLVALTGLIWVDRLVALALGVHMSIAGFKIIRKSLAHLLDAEDLKLLGRLAQIFESHAGDGIIQIHHTKVIRAGWFHHIDAHVVVPEFWTIEKSHDRLDIFENAVIGDYEYGGEMNFHLDPCRRKYCSVCDYQNCPVRVSPFTARIPVVLEHLRSKTEP